MSEPRTGRRAAVAGAKAVGATIALGVAVVTIGAAALLPLPTTAPEVPSVRVTPVATSQLAVCPGAFLRLGNDEGENADVATAIGTPSVLFGSTGADLTPGALDGPGSPTVLAAGEDPALISGSQTQNLSGSDVTGFTATECATPTADSWIVGGSTATGRTSVLTLANPTEVAATVSLDIFGEAGPISAPGASGIVVAPLSQQVVPLAALAPDTASPVIHVTSTGGLVVASLQESVVRGLEPAGADIVAATAKPAASVVIPGLVVTTVDDIEARIAADPERNADLVTAVRVFVPGNAPGTATVSVIPENGADGGASFPVDVPARTVLDISLQGIEEGSYSVSITSDVPLVAAVRSSTASGPDPAPGSSDTGWIAAPSALAEPSSFTVSPGPAPTLHLGNPTDAAIDVTLTAPDGTSSEVAVPAGESVSLPSLAGSWQISATGPVLANVGYSSSTQLATFSVEPRLADADPILIYP